MIYSHSVCGDSQSTVVGKDFGGDHENSIYSIQIFKRLVSVLFFYTVYCQSTAATTILEITDIMTEGKNVLSVFRLWAIVK